MIIGLTGNKGVGKDTAAAFLVQHCGFTRVAFADKMKEAVSALFNIADVDSLKGTRESEIPYCEVILEFGDGIQYSWSWREFLQRFGTEMGRGVFGDYFWIDFVTRQLDPEREQDVVVTDVRFNNEATALKSLGAKIIEITRPGHEPDGHASEQGVDSKYIDMRVINAAKIEDLEIDIYDAYKELNRV